MLRLIIVRHGQTEANIQRRLQGQSDGPLTSVGLEQAEKLALHLKDFHLDQVLSSELIRSLDTAAAIAKYHHIPVKTSPLLKEWNCGKLDGLPAEALAQALKQANTSIATFRPTGGETLEEVQQRAAVFLNELIASAQGQTVLVCSHGDFLRMLLSIILKKGIEEAETTIHFENASYSTYEYNNKEWKEIAFNQVALQ